MSISKFYSSPVITYLDTSATHLGVLLLEGLLLLTAWIRLLLLSLAHALLLLLLLLWLTAGISTVTLASAVLPLGSDDFRIILQI